MALTYFYAQLFGSILTIMGLAMLVQHRSILLVMYELIDNQVALFIVGFISLFVGTLVIVSHNFWSDGTLALIVTLLGWALLARALVILFLSHETLKKLFDALRIEKIYYLVTLFVLVIGIYLAYNGFHGY